MELREQERSALSLWMTDERLSQRTAAQKLGVAQVSLNQWLNGGGIRPAQHAKLLEQIKPYLKEPRQLGSSILDKIEAPDEIALHNRLLRIERYLQSQSVDLSRFDDKFSDWEVAEVYIPSGKENRNYREHEAPLRLAAGGGIPNSPTLARTAILEGDSMVPVFADGEQVDFSPFREAVRLGQEGYREFAEIKRLLNGFRYFYCQLNEDGLTVKGIELSSIKGSDYWTLTLVAENPDWGEEFGYQNGRRILRFGESLQIYGTVKKRG